MLCSLAEARDPALRGGGEAAAAARLAHVARVFAAGAEDRLVLRAGPGDEPLRLRMRGALAALSAEMPPAAQAAIWAELAPAERAALARLG
jgi:hypothetical protein